MPTKSKKINWYNYKIRTCMSMHGCRICEETIGFGEPYYDGGIGRRAHTRCVDVAQSKWNVILAVKVEIEVPASSKGDAIHQAKEMAWDCISGLTCIDYVCNAEAEED